VVRYKGRKPDGVKGGVREGELDGFARSHKYPGEKTPAQCISTRECHMP
jgi:hypothetical protein